MEMETYERGEKMNYVIVPVMEHYEAYINGEFLCSGDKRSETAREAEEILAERSEQVCYTKYDSS